MRLYYLTDAETAATILKERRLRMSQFSMANDPFELWRIDTRIRDTHEYAQLIYDHFDNNIGFICFGAAWKSPVMWAHYANRHKGVGLGFDVMDKLVSKIDYTDRMLEPTFGAHLPRHGLTIELLNEVRLTKAMEWAYENEYRVEGERKIKDPANGFYYTDFGPQLQLREVILGLRCTWTEADVRGHVGEVNQTVRICKAGPAFGRFEMVEQEHAKPFTIEPKTPS